MRFLLAFLVFLALVLTLDFPDSGDSSPPKDSNIVYGEPLPKDEVDPGIKVYRLGDSTSQSVSDKAESPTVLTFQLFFGDGELCASVPLTARIQLQANGQERIDETEVFSNEQGILRLVLESEYVLNSTRSLALISSGTDHHPERRVDIDLSVPYPPGEHDLGKLFLVARQPLVRGGIFDYSGIPIAGAHVFLEQQIEALYIPGERWERVPKGKAESEVDGSFEIYGKASVGQFRLVVERFGYAQGVSEVYLGEKNVEIFLSRSWTVRGRFLFDEGVSSTLFQVVTHYPEWSLGSGQVVGRGFMKPDGQFLIVDQPSGDFTLSLMSFVGGNEIFSKSLSLGPDGGEIQLDDIDLRGVLRKIVLDVRDGRGEFPFNIWVRSPGGTLLAKSSARPVELFTTETSLDLVVGAEDGQAVFLRGVEVDTEVLLSTALPVQIVVDNVPQIPDDFLLSYHLHYLNGGDHEIADALQEYSSAPFYEEDGVWLPAPGFYTFQLRLNGHSKSSHNENVVLDIFGSLRNLPIVEVIHTDDLQVFHVVLNQSDLGRIAEFLASFPDSD